MFYLQHAICHLQAAELISTCLADAEQAQAPSSNLQAEAKVDKEHVLHMNAPPIVWQQDFKVCSWLILTVTSHTFWIRSYLCKSDPIDTCQKH